MRPTNKEKADIAAKLRDFAEDCGTVPKWEVIETRQLPAPLDDVMLLCGLGRALHVTEICAGLADLVEPEPERTCRMRDTHWDHGELTWGCICSECGAERARIRGNQMNYCPNCGAKVVGR